MRGGAVSGGIGTSIGICGGGGCDDDRLVVPSADGERVVSLSESAVWSRRILSSIELITVCLALGEVTRARSSEGAFLISHATPLAPLSPAAGPCNKTSITL